MGLHFAGLGIKLTSIVAIRLGCVLAVAVNLLRPRYDVATGRWRAFYNYLLKQLPPPD